MPEPTTIGQRFTQLIQQLGLTKNAFAQAIGRTATVVQHLVDERNYPGYELLCRVFEVYPNVSRDWLLLGQGPMLLPSTTAELEPADALAAGSSSATQATLGAIDLGPLAEPVRRRNGQQLQAADIAAALSLASKAASAPPPAAVAPAMPAQAAPVPAASAPAAPPREAVMPEAPAAMPTPDTSALAAALHAQHLHHQLALAEQRSQHLQEQVALLKQLVALLQKTA